MDYETNEILRNLDQQWESLTIANDFVFGKVMLNEDLCREVLEAILGVSIGRIEYVGRQDDLDVSSESKGVRLDVHVRDDQGTVYNVEMQLTNTFELPRRSRYYQAMLALEQLERGERYRNLKDSYVIFICGFDLFGKGRRVYSFENRCCEDKDLALDDGMHTIFLSATAPTDPDKGRQVNELLDYVADGTITGELSSRLDGAVSEVLDNQRWRLEYMMQVVRDQLNVDKGHRLGLEEGREQGIKEGRKRGVQEGRQIGLEEGRKLGEAEGRKLGEAEGRKLGEAEGRKLGEAEGRKAGEVVGRRVGEDRLAKLIDRLMQDGRTEELSHLADRDARECLYKEYGITE